MDLRLTTTSPPVFYRTFQPRVDFQNHTVSDPILRNVLFKISLAFGKNLIITSGDRKQVVNGNTNSHHLQGRAADFYIDGMSLADTFFNIRKLDFISRGFQVIYHTENTTAPHIHIGRYHDMRPSNFMLDDGEILNNFK
ncbi:MAG: hypothetical protein KDD56_07225 [Bdellovibrionales bacterium]|nr:hypothetical protein [Bdellovibrionales bacterium]